MLTAAFDVGGSKLAGALLDDAGIQARLERPTPGPIGAADPGSAGLRALAAELAARAVGKVSGVGLSFCEYVDRGRLTSSEVMAWTVQPAEWLPAIFGDARVLVESDVRCGLLAEQRIGALRGHDSAVFVSWGTGLSSALLIDGAIWPGSRGRAIALGELGSPGPGTLEGYASGGGMAARYASLSGRTKAGARELLRAADQGDREAVEVADTAGSALADALAGLVRVIDPERVVLGGGLGCADATLAHRAVRRRWSELGEPAELVTAEVGPAGPLFGAALAAGWSGRGVGPGDGLSSRRGTGQR